MTKFKKITGIILAGCMTLSSLMMTAGAAEVSADSISKATALSAYAGETLECNLVTLDASGDATETFFEIDLPTNATNADQYRLVMNEVENLSEAPATRAARASWYELCYREDVFVPKNSDQALVNPNAASVWMDADYSRVSLYMSRIDPAVGTLNVRFESVPDGSPNSYTEMRKTVTNRECVVVVYEDDLALSFHNTLNAYVSGNSGSGTMNALLEGYR